MKTNKIVYYISTGLLTLVMLFSVSMYLFNNAQIQQAFTSLGYPTYIVYPLALAKILGLIAIWFVANKSIKEWAYAGFFFNFVLAFFAHYMVSDGGHMTALIAIILLVVSYIFSKKINNGK
ncbi:DoxX family protein [Polaribacter batillariae]|uniref:DoxX family protein n=1 Tax=Polaribacter batillariae TaxID=2808900 RepID=A0ABX7SUE5_9FLAO|nr:DoxX family protein [Polaribacter batillariae]QTD37512.1 DoxX family protein [Polaribacter batillariae]